MTGGVSSFFPEFKGTPEEGLRLIADRQLSPSVLARSAYCEKMLDNERRLGCRQYILFASGYDTYSIRNDDGELSVFELDLPDILSDKRERIEKAGLKSNANYVPCDLATDLWKVKLELLLHECGFLIYEHLDNEEMTKQYFSDYNNANPEHGMQAPEGVAYIMAVRT